MRDYNESTWVCSSPVESLLMETVIHILQTIFQIIFPSVLPRHFHLCSQMPMGFKKHSLQYPLSLCFIFPWPISWVMVYVVQREKKSVIHLLQATQQILFVLFCVLCCLSGVMHNFYLFLLLKLLLKQEMTVTPRRLNWGDTQMFILHYFSLPWQFL